MCCSTTLHRFCSPAGLLKISISGTPSTPVLAIYIERWVSNTLVAAANLDKTLFMRAVDRCISICPCNNDLSVVSFYLSQDEYDFVYSLYQEAMDSPNSSETSASI